MAKLKVPGEETKFLELLFFFQSTAAETYGIEGNPINNLIKVNVYYTSLNEKTTEDIADYDIEVCGLWYQILNEISYIK